MGSHVLSLVDQPTHFTWYWVTPFDSRPATTLDRLRLVRVLATAAGSKAPVTRPRFKLHEMPLRRVNPRNTDRYSGVTALLFF